LSYNAFSDSQSALSQSQFPASMAFLYEISCFVSLVARMALVFSE
jgi:hypothetical protein